MENFSSFISTCFIPTESSKDLIEGIIKIIFPIKSAWSSIRIDQAPGFRKLIKESVSIKELGMELNPGEAKNKNALAIVDKKISELEKEIKKLAPSNNVITVKILALATNIVNEKIKNQGMSAKEILFSRDQITSENLHFQDEEIVKMTMNKRKENCQYSSVSKSSTKKPAISANAQKGQLVFLKQEGSKFQRRDLYLVTNVDNSKNCVTICKIINALSNNPASFQPHNYIYNVKQTDIYLAPCQPTVLQPEIVVVEPPEYQITRESLQHPINSGSHSHLKSEVIDSDNWILEETTVTDDTPIDDDRNLREVTPEIYIHDDLRFELNANEVNHPPYVVDDLFDQRAPNPSLPPNPGDTIEFLDTEIEPYVIVKAKIMPKRQAVKCKWPNYFMVQRDDQPHAQSIDLSKIRWRYCEDILQVDGNYTLDDRSNLSDSMVSPTDDIDYNFGGKFSPIDHMDPHPFFIDDKLSDQESVFGYNHIENMTTTLSDSLRSDDQAHHLSDSDKRTIATLNLDIPASGRLAQNRVYCLPPINHGIKHLNSNSEADVSKLVLDVESRPAWYRSWTHFRQFLSRITGKGPR